MIVLSYMIPDILGGQVVISIWDNPPFLLLLNEVKMSNRVSNLKEDLLDCLLSDYPEISRENLLNEILDEYLFLINDIRKDELEDIIVNQFEAI